MKREKAARSARGTASFRRYELVSVCGIRAMESPFLPPVSADLFWCLVFDVLLVSSALRLCGAHHAFMARLASGFQGSRKSAKFHVSSGVIWGMSVSS